MTASRRPDFDLSNVGMSVLKSGPFAIGRAAAVADFGKIHISGFMAWLSWLFIHIFFLIGFRNRIVVLISWAWSYFTYERGARLITGDQNLPGWSEVPQEERTTESAEV